MMDEAYVEIFEGTARTASGLEPAHPKLCVVSGFAEFPETARVEMGRGIRHRASCDGDGEGDG